MNTYSVEMKMANIRQTLSGIKEDNPLPLDCLAHDCDLSMDEVLDLICQFNEKGCEPKILSNKKGIYLNEHQ